MNKTITGLLAFRNADSLIFSIIGFILILIYTRHSGIGISPDSIMYASAARNMNSHGTLLDYNLKSFVDFPVFYPLFLGVISFLSQTDAVAAGPYINGLLFACLIFCCGCAIGSFKENNRLYKIIILFFITLSPSLFDVYGMLWSETLFVLLSVLFILLFRRYVLLRSVSSLLLCAIIAAVGFITRYAGITFVATGCMLLFFDRSLLWRKKIVHLFLFGICSISLLLMNLIRNAMISDSLTGPREAGTTGLSDNIYYYGKVICWWLSVPDHAKLFVCGLAIFIFLVVCVLFTKHIWSAKAYLSTENYFAAFFIVYTVFIIGVSTLSRFEQINNRFIAPLFIPLLLTLTYRVPAYLVRLSGSRKRITLVAVSAVILIFQFSQIQKVYAMYQEARDYGIAGYTDDSWRNSPTAEFLRKHKNAFKPGYMLYSNAAEAAYFNGNIYTTSLPHWVEPKEIEKLFRKKQLYLIWFREINDPDLINLELLHQRASVTKQYSFKDGDIYLIKPNTKPLP